MKFELFSVIYGDLNCQIKCGLTSHFIPHIESTASLITPLNNRKWWSDNFTTMTEDNIEQYELKEIFSPEMINQRRAKLCTVCGRTVACCVWKSTIGFSCWKYCLDCQDDNFPDWRYEWNSFLSSCGVSLSQDQIAEIVARCSKNLTFEMPEFPLLSASDDSTCQINYPSVTKPSYWCQWEIKWWDIKSN